MSIITPPPGFSMNPADPDDDDSRPRYEGPEAYIESGALGAYSVYDPDFGVFLYIDAGCRMYSLEEVAQFTDQLRQLIDRLHGIEPQP